MSKSESSDKIAAGPVGNEAVATPMKVVSTITALACAILLMCAQLNMTLLFLIGVGVTVLALLVLHLMDRRRGTFFFGPIASHFFTQLVVVLVYLNVLWALRWFLGVHFVVADMYGVVQTDIDFLQTCALEEYMGRTAMPRCISPIAAFLAHPWAVYFHAAGAITAMAVGPLQLWPQFREKHLQLHRMTGYLYCLGVTLGTIGSLCLIAVSTSGLVVGIGFILLAALWMATLTLALVCVKRHRVSEHRRWMIRNYSLTLAAVLFHIIPLLFQSITGLDGQISYVVGGWATLILAVVLAEAYIWMYHKPMPRSAQTVAVEAAMP